MSEVVLSISGLSKQYQLGQFGTGTLSHDLNRWYAKIRGKEDPYRKVAEVNDRTVSQSSKYVWALKDIDMDIQQGDVVGIIGRNGAGKSTLLKILSRITAPSAGTFRYKGRLGALLEVGTGFHPELTGMENVFLNGAIMGMTKAEIKSKLDEIIDFSGCEKYLDTPVKRYSSGMIVRLGFSVAAHLDPEILIVDEVLAVGDTEFQKKCLGKMKDVSSSGRTILFVSHNLGSVSELCTRAVLLKNGQMCMDGKTADVIQHYRESFSSALYEKDGLQKEEVSFEGLNILLNNENLTIHARLINKSGMSAVTCGFLIKDQWGQKVGTVVKEIKVPANVSISFSVELDCSMLVNGNYFIDAALFVPGVINYEYLDDIVAFELTRTLKELNAFENKNIGSVRFKSNWKTDE